MTVDVCVIGAGPSGTIAALELARLGFRVRLLHGADARKHWPETVSPQLRMLLGHLGLGDALACAICTPVVEKWLLWRGEDAIRLAQPGTVIVDRDRLDMALRDCAVRAGVEIKRGRARRPVPTSLGKWRVPMEDGSATEADFIVIATGRGAQRGALRKGDRMVAYYGTALRAPMPVGTMAVGSTPGTWYWSAAVSDGSLRMLVFKASHAAKSKVMPADLLRQALRSLAPESDSEALHFVRATDATSRSSAAFAGENWIRTGDAMLTVDPLNSSGLYVAALSSVQAARVINTVLRRPGNAASALSFYADAQTEILEHCAAQAEEFYRAGMRGGTIGAPAATPAHAPARLDDLVLSPGLCLEAVPVLSGDFVTEVPGIRRPHKRPIAFIDGNPIAALLAPLREGKTLSEAAGCWPQLSHGSRERLMRLLAEERIAVAAE